MVFFSLLFSIFFLNVWVDLKSSRSFMWYFEQAECTGYETYFFVFIVYLKCFFVEEVSLRVWKLQSLSYVSRILKLLQWSLVENIKKQFSTACSLFPFFLILWLQFLTLLTIGIWYLIKVKEWWRCSWLNVFTLHILPWVSLAGA